MTLASFLRPPPHGRLAAWRARPLRPALGRRGLDTTLRPPGTAPQRRASEVLAHDLNNLLAVILAASETLAQALPAGSYDQELAQVSQDAAERAAALLARGVDASGHPGPSERGADAADAIRRTARLTRLSPTDTVRIQCDIAEHDLTCTADGPALASALLNLCVNARHAMPHGGVLTLSADIVGSDVVIRVSDTGSGMSAATLARATEPGFTTRRAAGGTGLGLTSVADLARRCGGQLVLASRNDHGTTVTLRLPRAVGY